jgi:hypothetical protein
MANDHDALMHELNALANRIDAIRIAVKGAIPSETCGVIGIRYLLADAASRLRDLMEFGPKGITRSEPLGDV